MLCFLGILGLSNLHPSRCAKLTSWRGPDTFFEGTLPSNRNLHGFATCDDGWIYVFGGVASTGEALSVDDAKMATVCFDVNCNGQG